ncbi:hypothetical protein OXX59_003176 [Metschnikowia pulcherrima]
MRMNAFPSLLIAVNSVPAICTNDIIAPRVHLAKRFFVTPQTATKQIAHQIDWASDMMRSFVSGPEFDYASFDASSSFLGEHLSDIKPLLEHVTSDRKNLCAQFAFAQRMYHVMQDCAYFMRLYSTSAPEHVLLRHILQLNVQILGLYDSNGFPDLCTESFTRTVMRLTHNLHEWDVAFENLDEMSLSTYLVYDNQFLEAQKSLFHLARFAS